MLTRESRLEDARKWLEDGLRPSRTKYVFCSQMGNLELKAGNLSSAVLWWIRSVVTQVRKSKIRDDDPFVRLAYVADELRLRSVQAKLLQVADRLSAWGRLDYDAATEIANKTRRQATTSISNALLRLESELSSDT
jgi:hypothetical protein